MPQRRFLSVFSDADYACDSNDRTSISGYVYLLFGNFIMWTSRKQSTVAVSSTEAEHISFSETTSKDLWIQKLLKDIQVEGTDNCSRNIVMLCFVCFILELLIFKMFSLG